MSQHVSLPAQPVDSERQPLLTESPTAYTSQSHTDNQESNHDAGGEQPDQLNGKHIRNNWAWGTSKAAVYVLFWGIVVLSAILFIKAFIQAGKFDFDYKKALDAALSGGIAGAAAMILQVLTLMPLRTILNYQYRYGTTTSVACRTLYTQSPGGGIVRFYQGLTAALVQAPLARFGDAFANEFTLALLASNPTTNEMPIEVKTVFASIMAALFRIVLTPVDTLKTTLQTQGSRGWGILGERVRVNGLGSLWYGAVATAAATFVGYYPWWGTQNALNRRIPAPDPSEILLKLLRYAFIGFVSSVVSDVTSNSLRVLKTYRQVNETKISYLDAAREVVETDGWKGLFGRGLKTKILANGLQGLMFTVLWRLFLERLDDKSK